MDVPDRRPAWEEGKLGLKGHFRKEPDAVITQQGRPERGSRPGPSSGGVRATSSSPSPRRQEPQRPLQSRQQSPYTVMGREGAVGTEHPTRSPSADPQLLPQSALGAGCV